MFLGRVQIGKPAESRPYIPSFAADDKLLAAPQEVEEPGVLAANGLLPGASNGGLIRVAGQELGSDFVAVEGDLKQLYILPAEKGGVEVEDPDTNLGSPHLEGATIFSNHAEGVLYFANIYTGNVWKAEEARSEGHRVAKLNTGLWVIQAAMMHAQITDFEVGGVVRARLF